MIASRTLSPSYDSYHDDDDYRLYIVMMTRMMRMIIIHSVRGLKEPLSGHNASVVHQDAHNPNLKMTIKIMMRMMMKVMRMMMVMYGATLISIHYVEEERTICDQQSNRHDIKFT